jgi:RimJ/RimL family protein N-acetyltransferase
VDISLEQDQVLLRPLPPAAARALPGRREHAAREIGTQLSPDWPQPDLLDVLPLQANATPEQARWGIWVIIDRSDQLVVGDIGFFGPPSPDGEVEIGYSIVPTHRRRGFATHAATALVGWARAQPGVHCVTARCAHDNEPSIRTLRRLGFQCIGQSGDEVRWRDEPVR